jgi:hypothetical protein
MDAFAAGGVVNDQQLAFDIATKGSKDRERISRVLAIIRQHVGRDNAIKPAAVADLAKISYRDVQAVVKFLVEDMGKPIGTATSQPFGYYMIRDVRELQQNYRHFVRRGVSNLRHARAFNKASIVGPIVGQLEIEIGEKEQ